MILAILVLTRSLQHALHLFQLIQFCLHYFCTVSYFLLVCLCDRVDDVPFEGEQEQAYEEENQQLNEEGKWIFPLYMFHFDPNNRMINTLPYCSMHEIDGNPIKDIT